MRALALVALALSGCTVTNVYLPPNRPVIATQTPPPPPPAAGPNPCSSVDCGRPDTRRIV